MRFIVLIMYFTVLWSRYIKIKGGSISIGINIYFTVNLNEFMRFIVLFMSFIVKKGHANTITATTGR